MGEIADAIINGDFDEQTGEWLGEGDGFPRTLNRGYKVTKQSGKEMTSRDCWRGVNKYLQNKYGYSNKKQIIKMKQYLECKDLSPEEMAVEIQKDFGKFVKWIKSMR